MALCFLLGCVLEMSGGDYDGDRVLCIWNPDIVNNVKPQRAAPHSSTTQPAPATHLQSTSETLTSSSRILVDFKGLSSSRCPSKLLSLTCTCSITNECELHVINDPIIAHLYAGSHEALYQELFDNTLGIIANYHMVNIC